MSVSKFQILQKNNSIDIFIYRKVRITKLFNTKNKSGYIICDLGGIEMTMQMYHEKKRVAFTNYHVQHLSDYIEAAIRDDEVRITKNTFLIRSIEHLSCEENTLLVDRNGYPTITVRKSSELFQDYGKTYGIEDWKKFSSLLKKYLDITTSLLPRLTVWHCFTCVSDELWINLTSIYGFKTIREKFSHSIHTSIVNEQGIRVELSLDSRLFKTRFYRDMDIFCAYRTFFQAKFCENPDEFDVFKHPNALNDFLVAEFEEHPFDYMITMQSFCRSFAITHIKELVRKGLIEKKDLPDGYA